MSRRHFRSVATLLIACIAACESDSIRQVHHVAFLAQPAASTASTQSLGNISVGLSSEDGRILTGVDRPIQIALVATDTAAHLNGTTSVSSAGGTAHFTDLSVARAGTGYRLRVSTAGLADALSQAFDITVGSPSKLRFESAVVGTTAGSTLASIPVSITDAGGNRVTTASDSIQLVLSSSATLFGTTKVAASSGLASFSGLSIQKSGTTSFVASASGLMNGTSNSFLVSPGPLTKLAFFAQPADTKAGATMPVIQVYAADAYGNGTMTPPGGSMSVTIVLGNNPTGATLSGTLSKSGFVAGTAFTDLVIDKPGTYTLVVTGTFSGPLASATSISFNISP